MPRDEKEADFIPSRVFFKGKRQVKIIDHYAHPFVEANVLPFIVQIEKKDDDGEHETWMGLYLFCTPVRVLNDQLTEAQQQAAQEPFTMDGTTPFIDPICWWRALRLFQHIHTITELTFGMDIFLAAEQHLDEQKERTEKQYRTSVREALDQASRLDDILTEPVPAPVLNTLLQMHASWESDLLRDARCTASDEVEAGTVDWRIWGKRLAGIGVVHPTYRRAVQAAQDQIVHRYQDALFSLASTQGHHYSIERGQRSGTMIKAEWHLYECITKGIEQEYGADITIALAMAYAEISIDDAYDRYFTKFPARCRQGYVRPTKQERFEQCAAWLFHFWMENQERNTIQQPMRHQEIIEILNRLHEELPTRPVTHLLVIDLWTHASS